MDILKIDQKLDRIERLLLHNKSVLTFEEACEYTGISSSYMYKLTAKKKIPHSCPNGKMLFFEKKKLDIWLLQNERKTIEEINSKAISYTHKNKR